MKSISAGLAAHLALETTTLCTLWLVTRTDGDVFAFTDHDEDVQYPVSTGPVYQASSGYTRSTIQTTGALNVDNLDMEGVLDAEGITEADLRAGLWDYATVQISAVNWADLTQGALALRKGRLGEVTAGRLQFRAELRGLMQQLQQSVGRLYGILCDADFGDARCGIDLTGEYVDLPGASGDYVSTPDAAVLDIIADIQFVACVAADDYTPAAAMDIIAKWKNSTNERSYQFLISTAGNVQIMWSANGIASNTITSAATIPVANGAPVWLKATLDVNNGAGGNTANFYYSTDAIDTAPGSVSWTALGAPVITGGIAALLPNSVPLEIGSVLSGTSQVFDGKIYRAQTYAGISGTLVADFDARDWRYGTTFASSTTGETYTLNGAASIKHVSPWVKSGTVTGVTSNRVFADSARAEANGFFDYGKITFWSGLNAGLSMEVKSYLLSGGALALQLPMPYTVAIGDAYTMQAGCKKRFTEDCVGTYANGVNFRGFPHVPGSDQMASGGL